MDFLNLVKKRQSTRRYLNKPVERDKIERCIEAARLAPSATNTQPWKFIVVDNPELREKVANKTFNQIVSFNRFSLQAPVLIVITSNRMNFSNKITQTLKNRELTPIDIGIAAEHICLQAAEEGLGTCFMGWFDEKGVKKLLNIPASKRVELIIAMGYPASDIIRAKTRKKLNEIMTYNHY